MVLVGVAVGMLGFTFYLGARMLLDPNVLSEYQSLLPGGASQLPWFIGYVLPYVIPLILLYILAAVIAGRMFKWGERFVGKVSEDEEKDSLFL